jgi:hypothetical protein
VVGNYAQAGKGESSEFRFGKLWLEASDKDGQRCRIFHSIYSD